jgi:hypothetical protein
MTHSHAVHARSAAHIYLGGWHQSITVHTFVALIDHRVEWAQLESSVGNLSVARQLLEEGLELHPRFGAAHVAMARVERLSGNLDAAQQVLRRAAQVSLVLVITDNI